jgi:hypothetical protein
MDHSPYAPDEDDIPVNRHVPIQEAAYFSVRTGYGKGKPHFFVSLDENGGEQSWWMAPDQAELLGAELLRAAVSCRHADERHP